MIPSSGALDKATLLNQGGLLDRADANAVDKGHYLDLQSMASLQAMSHSDDPKVKSAALHEVGAQFESMLVKQMLDTMRKTTESMFKDSLFNPESVRFYQSMLDDQMSLEISGENGIGLAKQFVANLSARYGLEDYHSGVSGGGTSENGALDNGELDNGELDNGSSTAVSGFNPEQDFQQLVRRINVQASAFSLPIASDVLFDTDGEIVGESSEFSQITANQENNSAAKQTDNHSDAYHEFFAGKAPQNAEEFVTALQPYANKVGEELGVDPAQVLAQVVLETGWGNKIIRDEQGNNSFNLFGIKADQRWQGDDVTIKTTEYFSSNPIQVEAKFRSYQSYAESFDDFVQFVKTNERYQTALESAPNEFYSHLHQAGYATDPQYVNKIHQLASRIGEEFLGGSGAEAKSAASENSPADNVNQRTSLTQSVTQATLDLADKLLINAAQSVQLSQSSY